MAVSGTLVKRIMVKITADDMDAEEKMDAIGAKAEELSKLHPELEVKIKSAAAMAQMKVLRDEIKAATAAPVDLDPAVQAAADERMKSMRENLQQLADRAGKFREAVQGDKEALASLLGLNAGLEHMKENLSEGGMSPSAMAAAEAQMARFDAQLDKLRAGLEHVPEPAASWSSQQSWSALWTDPAAAARLSALLAQIEAMSAKAQDIKFTGKGAGELQLTLDKLRLQMDELSDKTVDPKFDVRGLARGEVELEGINLQVDKLKAKADADNAGLLSRLLLGARGKLGGLVGGIPGLGGIGGSIAGDAEDAGGSGPGGAGVMGGIIAALVAASPAIVTELTGVVSGFAAAGAGLGAFGVLAIPTIKQVTADLGDTKAQLDKLPWPIRQTVGEVKNLEGQFDQLAKKYAPEVSNLLSQAAAIVSENAPKILDTLAKPVFPAVSGLLTGMNKELKSKGFGDWLKQFSSLEGPSIGAIGTGVGHLADSIGKLLTLMSSKDVVNSINIAFSIIDGALVGLIGFVHYTMVTWDALTTAWDKSTGAVRRAGHGIAEGFDVARHGAATAGHDIAGAFDVTRHGAATAGHATASAFDLMRGRIATALDGDLAFVRSHWKAVASFLVDPVATAVFEVRTHLHQMAREFDTLRHDTASILAGMRHDIAAAFDGARHDAAAAAAGLRHDVANAWDGARHDAARWGDDMIHAVTSAWDSIFGASKKGSGQVTGEVGKLPGQITSLLARLPGDMLAIGRNTILGLIHGIESAAAAIPSIMMGLAHSVEHYFTDPLSIFSPSRVMYEHGLMVPEGVALGIEAGSPRIRQAAAGMARAVSGTALGAHGTTAGTAAAGSHVTIQITGDAALRQWLKKSIRVTGGNVQVVGA